MNLPIYIRATFSPQKRDDLHDDGCLPIGHRGVWESTRVIDEGPYAGQREWSPATLGRWVPDCDLADRESATRQDFNAEALRAQGVTN